MPLRLPRFMRFALATLPFFSGAIAFANAQTQQTPASQQAPASSSTLQITGLGGGVVPLGGKWQFHTGDDPAWSSPTLNDSSWQQIVTSKGVGEQSHFAYSGYAWYRRHIDLRIAPDAKPDLAILLDVRNGPCELFWNGVPIGRVGGMPPRPWFPFRPPPQSFSIPSGPGVLAIRTWLPPLKFVDSGLDSVIQRTPLVGSAESVTAELGAIDHLWLKSVQFYFFSNLLYGIVGTLGLIVFLRNREHRFMLWASLFALMQPIHVLLFNAHLPLTYAFATGVNQITSAIGDVSLWYLLLYLLELNTNTVLWRWARRLAIVDAVSAVVACLILFFDWSKSHVAIYQFTEAISSIPIGIFPVFTLVLLVCALRKRVALANWLVAITAAALEMISVVAVTSLQGARFTHWHAVYAAFRYRILNINGNYFDPANIAATLLLFAILYAVFQYFLQQTNRQNSLEQEFKSAQEVQRILIPETLPPLPGFAVTSAYLPAQEVGGDFFQVFARPAGFAIVVVGDVSGKGLRAAMSVSLIIGSLRAIVDVFHDPAEILSRLNHRLFGRMQGGFATCVVMRLDRDGRCTIANAGHLSPFLNCDELDLPPALPLGLTNTADYDEVTVHLKVDDRLTLYTDGLLEARNKAGELYGFDRVSALISTCPDAHQASEAAIAFGQDDDITVLTVTRLAFGVESTTSLKAPELIPSAA